MPPLRVYRFNDNGRHPNAFISFIKPHASNDGADRRRAQSILSRCAAAVYPIMKAHGLQVTSLEEQPFNDSWAGMNWNAGECISLVLRTRDGGWVPERFVLAVLLHELSHCTNMHHARPFWATLAGYKREMAALTARGYTGEGFWGGGKVLGSGDSSSLADGADDAELLPRSLCGGTGRRRTRTRRRRVVPSTGRPTSEAAKKRKRHIGDKLGGDLALRRQLDGRATTATPTQANSRRGKDLRAAAAEARMRASTIEDEVKAELDDDMYEDIDVELDDGVKVEDEDIDTQALLKREFRQSLLPFKPIVAVKAEHGDRDAATQTDAQIKREPADAATHIKREPRDTVELSDDETDDGEALLDYVTKREHDCAPDPCSRPYDEDESANVRGACPVCTCVNDAQAIECAGCGCDRSDRPGWRCSNGCPTTYMNPIERPRCGLCDTPRTTAHKP